MHGGELTDAFQVRTGVRQGCLLSPFPFLLVVDWIMKTSTSEGKHEIKWTTWNQLDDLELTDDLARLFHIQKQIQINTASVAAVSESVGLNTYKVKARSSNTTRRTPTQSYLTEKLWKMWKFSRICLDTIDKQRRGSGVDVKARMSKERTVFI
ncbi:unnamed protein product [Schistosoma curassoni]|uniref:Reverse transcriptase domain-containing protein n=1 Tax=Schistosoma curassoni TaxID=6186 RepID=A0A183K957_9TREM|nr:unnamed protein product [Schistosoma curassoni]